MSRKVRVTSIGENHRAYDGSRDFEKIVKTESDFIIGEIEKVISESPDLIVLPEVYDRTGGKVKAMKEKYRELVEIETPRGLGCIMITSNHPDISAPDMAKEFEIELLDDLFARGRKQRADFLGE
jgi:hypothetical protein